MVTISLPGPATQASTLALGGRLPRTLLRQKQQPFD